MTIIRDPNISAVVIRALISYDCETGIVRWLPRAPSMFSAENPSRACTAWNAKCAGKVAGFDSKWGRLISLFGKKMAIARVIWIFVTGEWPSEEVDHKDVDCLNNRWSNLREATHQQNSANKRKPTKNSSGFKGVSWYVDRGAYRARIKVGKRVIMLGTFADAEEAHCAYAKAAERYFGSFARVA